MGTVYCVGCCHKSDGNNLTQNVCAGCFDEIVKRLDALEKAIKELPKPLMQIVTKSPDPEAATLLEDNLYDLA